MIDYTQGFDNEVLEEEVKAPENVVAMPKRAPYTTWTVDGREFKLRLTAANIAKLEQMYKKNLLLVVTDDGIPPVAVMLTVIQAAMSTHHHGMKLFDVQALYDTYVDEGGDQNALMSDVILPLLTVSGFFTPAQAEMLTREMNSLDSSI